MQSNIINIISHIFLCLGVFCVFWKRDIFKEILKLKTMLARNILPEKYFNSLEMFAIGEKKAINEKQKNSKWIRIYYATLPN